MILRNYYKILDAMLQGNETDNSTIFVKVDGNTFNGRYYNASAGTYAGALGFINLTAVRESVNNTGIVFGDGTTQPSFNDYTLAGSCITGLTGTVVRTGTSNADGSAEATAIITVTNSNSYDVTIGEVGYVENLVFSYANGSNKAGGYYMLDRTVLDTPVTIPAGGIGQVTYTIRMNYPTA